MSLINTIIISIGFAFFAMIILIIVIYLNNKDSECYIEHKDEYNHCKGIKNLLDDDIMEDCKKCTYYYDDFFK